MAMDFELTQKNEDLEEKVNALMEKPTTTKVNYALCSINFQNVKLRLYSATQILREIESFLKKSWGKNFVFSTQNSDPETFKM